MFSENKKWLTFCVTFSGEMQFALLTLLNSLRNRWFVNDAARADCCQDIICESGFINSSG